MAKARKSIAGGPPPQPPKPVGLSTMRGPVASGTIAGGDDPRRAAGAAAPTGASCPVKRARLEGLPNTRQSMKGEHTMAQRPRPGSSASACAPTVTTTSNRSRAAASRRPASRPSRRRRAAQGVEPTPARARGLRGRRQRAEQRIGGRHARLPHKHPSPATPNARRRWLRSPASIVRSYAATVEAFPQYRRSIEADLAKRLRALK